MEIKCRCCGEYFSPSNESLDMLIEGFICSESINTCNECWDLLQISEYDYSDFSDAEPGL